MPRVLRPPVILAYHGIARVSPPLDPVRLFVSPERLRGQIARLKSRGYRFLSMREFATQLHAGADLRSTCALTFDDGAHDLLPDVLHSLSVPGTVYVCPDLMGKRYPWCGEEAGIRLMTRDEVLDFAKHPMVEIGSHTNRHTELDSASEEEAYAQMASSKQRLEDMLGERVDSFAYPRCHYSAACPAAAERAGYTSAVTCGPRGSWSPFELRRESMHTPDGPVTFAFKSRGLYYGARDRLPFRLARWITRPYRHRGE
jgi:peptidoglycan/xylan/chitin deacetylase (PgdA/CDA1 family)